jgi:hypothetical protein
MVSVTATGTSSEDAVRGDTTIRHDISQKLKNVLVGVVQVARDPQQDRQPQQEEVREGRDPSRQHPLPRVPPPEGGRGQRRNGVDVRAGIERLRLFPVPQRRPVK